MAVVTSCENATYGHGEMICKMVDEEEKTLHRAASFAEPQISFPSSCVFACGIYQNF